jgi:hypothetical protein
VLPAAIAAVFALSVPRDSTGMMTITFDEPPSAGDTRVSWMIEQDMRLSTTNGFTHRASGSSSFFPDNGSSYAGFLAGDKPLVISNTIPLAFDLVSVDLAEYSSVFAIAWTIPFTGYRADGSTVAISFVLDGVIDGTGPAADFQTFYFGSTFTNVLYVQVGQSLYSMDNLRIEPVPEPPAILLAAVSLALLGGWHGLRNRRCRLTERMIR